MQTTELSSPPPPPLPHLLYGYYTLTVTTTVGPISHRRTLTLGLSVDTRLPDLDFFEARSAPTLDEAYLLTGDIPSHLALAKQTIFADRLSTQIRAAFGMPKSCILTLTLPMPGGVGGGGEGGTHTVPELELPISPLNVITSLSTDLKSNPHQPNPRRARLQGLDTDRLTAVFQALSLPLLAFPPPPTLPVTEKEGEMEMDIGFRQRFTARIHLLTVQPWWDHAQVLVVELREPNTVVVELVDRVREWAVLPLVGRGSERGGSGEGDGECNREKAARVRVVLLWAGVELPGFVSLSENMFDQAAGVGVGVDGRGKDCDREMLERQGEGEMQEMKPEMEMETEEWVVELTARLEGMAEAVGVGAGARGGAGGGSELGGKREGAGSTGMAGGKRKR